MVAASTVAAYSGILGIVALAGAAACAALVSFCKKGGPPKTPAPKRFVWNIRGHRFGHPVLVVIGAFFSMLGLGVAYSWGTLSPFVSDPGFMLSFPPQQTIFCFALALSLLPLSMMAAGPVQRKIGTTATAFISAIMAGIGIMLSALATHIGIMLVTWGLLFGGGVGFGYVTAVVLSSRWFPAQKGLVSGIVVGGFGAGSFVFNLIIKAMCNPHGLPTKGKGTESAIAAWRIRYHSEMLDHVPAMFLVIGALAFALPAVGSLALRPPPPSVQAAAPPPPKEEVDDEETAGETKAEREARLAAKKNAEAQTRTKAVGVAVNAAPGNALGPQQSMKKRHMLAVRAKSFGEASFKRHLGSPGDDVNIGFKPSQMIRTPQFWLLWGMFGFCLLSGMFTIGSYASFITAEGSFACPFDIVGGLAALANAAGRIVWGKIVDLIDYRRVIFIDALLLGTEMFVYALTKDSLAAYTIVTMLIYFSYGGFLGVFPTAAADAFGLKYVSQNYSILFTSTALASILQAVLLTVLLKALKEYRKLFWVMGGGSFIGALLALAYKPPNRGVWFGIWISYNPKAPPKAKPATTPEPATTVVVALSPVSAPAPAPAPVVVPEPAAPEAGGKDESSSSGSSSSESSSAGSSSSSGEEEGPK
jgi:MFS family permease